MSARIEKAIWEWRVTPVVVPNPKLKSPREGFNLVEKIMIFERDRFTQADYVLCGREAYLEARQAYVDDSPIKIAGVPVMYVPDLDPQAIHVVTKFWGR